MKKSDLTCSIPMAKLLTGVPDEAEIGSITVFAGVKGSGVFMGSQMAANPEEIAAMLSAFSEAKQSVIEGIIRDHGMQMMVSVMFFLASSHPDADFGIDTEELMRRYAESDGRSDG